MAGSILAHTNLVIAHFNGSSALLDLFHRFSDVVIPSIVLGELYFGAARSARAAENTKKVDEVSRLFPVAACDAATGQHYGQIKHLLRQKGTPIPENDIWIAALATQHSASLATRDAHFSAVAGLSIETW